MSILRKIILSVVFAVCALSANVAFAHGGGMGHGGGHWGGGHGGWSHHGGWDRGDWGRGWDNRGNWDGGGLYFYGAPLYDRGYNSGSTYYYSDPYNTGSYLYYNY